MGNKIGRKSCQLYALAIVLLSSNQFEQILCGTEGVLMKPGSYLFRLDIFSNVVRPAQFVRAANFARQLQSPGYMFYPPGPFTNCEDRRIRKGDPERCIAA